MQNDEVQQLFTAVPDVQPSERRWEALLTWYNTGMDYPGWTVETTHPIDPEAEGYCETCAAMVPEAISFADGMGFVAYGSQTSDANGTHNVVVRKVVEETE
jgi:hypothetical protein